MLGNVEVSAGATGRFGELVILPTVLGSSFLYALAGRVR
jgi:hypothetical protein